MVRGALLLGLAVAASFGQKIGAYRGNEEKLPVKVSPQPIAFSHKKHAAAGLPCLACHGDAKERDQAGIPNVKQCVLCHLPDRATHPELKRLAELDKRGAKVRWVRVYRVPDFVFFSHANHLKAGEKCATCHGTVETSEVLAREVSTSMDTCVVCHFPRKASNECYLCHDLGQ